MKFEFKSISAQASKVDWNNWQWQLKNRLQSSKDYGQFFKLTDAEEAGFKASINTFKVSTTPYYARLAQSSNAIRRILMPHSNEQSTSGQQLLDPLGEKINSQSKRLVHRYSDRVLFLVTDFCSVYCRYCTRKHFTGHDKGFVLSDDYFEALNYIKKNKGIREVILSGGDPLTLSNTHLKKVLTDLREIEHIEIIRMGSRMPVVCPMRVDQELIQILRGEHDFGAPVFMMVHFNHPKEITLEAAKALSQFVDSGIPVFNQTVLLNGVNNHVNIIQALNRRLLYLRVKPYYLFQCDPSFGTEHLRTPIEEGEKIISQMWGHFSGLAMANFSLDIPGGGGKTTLVPNFTTSKNEHMREFIGWDMKAGIYENPKTPSVLPEDYLEYELEWENLKNSLKLAQDEHTLQQISL
ncbi:MAG: KamA family radical SAM protein [Oligoflexia bacterium]|nr:KamA family radical SAM protein [Oligoflexia bacterium]